MVTFAILRPRQAQIVDYLVHHPDAHDKDIAQEVGLATHTVKIHLSRAMEVYGVKTRTGLVAKVLKERFNR